MVAAAWKAGRRVVPTNPEDTQTCGVRAPDQGPTRESVKADWVPVTHPRAAGIWIAGVAPGQQPPNRPDAGIDTIITRL